ncbi:MAG: UDP-N-acetylmuramoyl-L-alanine--D-glutamate ligase [Opitutaceae bacterium]|nr:UDP-N-acetylmuramoyl-L-alanine--D-glutamate ligase [Cytophagales bacterium]
MKDFKNIIILGSGESGTGAALLAKAQGFDVFVSDSGEIAQKHKEELIKNLIPFEEGAHTWEVIADADQIIKSPGIPDKAEIMKKIYASGIPVISEIEFGFQYSIGKIIAVTGSNGKTTTTSLIYHILKEAGFKVGLGGNIGESFARKAIDNPYDVWVLELSSFQLDHCFTFRPDISVLMNITPDHLDRYEYKFENYIDSKFRIIQAQQPEDKFIVFTDNEPIVSELQKRAIKPQILPISLVQQPVTGAWLDNKSLIVNAGKQSVVVPLDKIAIQGKHNMLNAMASITACLEAGVPADKILEGLQTFKPVEHRLEPVADIEGIHFINDSKATNVDSVFYALDSMKTPVILIAGGVDKGNEYSQIEELVKKKVKLLVCMGKDNSKLLAYFDGKVEIKETSSIEQAVAIAFNSAKKGDTVLLSPACASFDLFKNYEDRGKQFKQQVGNLKAISSI